MQFFEEELMRPEDYGWLLQPMLPADRRALGRALRAELARWWRDRASRGGGAGAEMAVLFGEPDADKLPVLQLQLDPRPSDGDPPPGREVPPSHIAIGPTAL